jgi:predicted transcriptional regulator
VDVATTTGTAAKTTTTTATSKTTDTTATKTTTTVATTPTVGAAKVAATTTTNVTIEGEEGDVTIIETPPPMDETNGKSSRKDRLRLRRDKKNYTS